MIDTLLENKKVLSRLAKTGYQADEPLHHHLSVFISISLMSWKSRSAKRGQTVHIQKVRLARTMLVTTKSLIVGMIGATSSSSCKEEGWQRGVGDMRELTDLGAMRPFER